ncbi:hypothetical protein QUF80_05070 [Desulfococcaceae bacterium HSG8]|nr:hypothetical protein [Desulfococcaceae bacterium HSG8]
MEQDIGSLTMLSDETGKQLHDRVTLGKVLTPEEHNLLEKWYNNQDNAESELLKSNTDLQSEKHIAETD